MMPERPNTTMTMPGYGSGPTSIPGQAKDARVRSQTGRGTLGAEQAEAQRLFRTRSSDEYTAPLPRKTKTLADVTEGLGLASDIETRVQKMVGETRADFTKKGPPQRSFLSTGGLVSSLRRMSDVPSDVRMEIVKRARAYWQNTQPTDYGREPIVRAPQKQQMRVGKSGRFVVRSDIFFKAVPNAAPPREPEDDEQAPPPAPPAAPPQAGAATPAQGNDPSKPPPGFAPIPNSKKGGYRQKTAQGWVYWYPGAGLTSTPHPADRGKGRAQRAAAKGKGGKGAPPPPQAGAGGPQEPADASAGGASPPPLPKGAGGPQKPPAGPPGAGAPPQGGPPQAGAQGPQQPPKKPRGMPKGSVTPPPGASTGMQPAAAANAKPQVQRDENGETRSFHPAVQASVPKGKENDHEHHAAEFEKHKAAKKQAMAAGDQERAKAHTYAMNFHADKHNRIVAESQGRQYNPRQQYPGAEDPNEAVRESYERVPGSPTDEQGNPVSAANQRERFVPEAQSVKGMREKLGRAVNIMADLSGAHDHLSSLKAKRKQVKMQGGPLARRMVSQIDAEIAATKHDIVQLEDAHNVAMQEVAAAQKQLRSERIRNNPVFQAFMRAMQALQQLSSNVGQRLGEGIESAKDALSGPAAVPPAFGPSADADMQDDEDGVVKPLGVDKDDIEAKFGSPEKRAQEQQLSKEALDALDKLSEEHGDDQIGDEDVQMVGDDDEGEEGEGSVATYDDLHGEEGGGSEAENAIKDIFGMQAEREQKEAQQAKDAEESQGFDNDIAAMRAKKQAAEQQASAQADKMAARSKRTRGYEEGKPGESGEEKGTVASGVRRKKPAADEKSTRAIKVKKSAVLVKSAEWHNVMRLGAKLTDTLRKSTRLVPVVPRRGMVKALPPLTFYDLYG